MPWSEFRGLFGLQVFNVTSVEQKSLEGRKVESLRVLELLLLLLDVSFRYRLT